MVEARMLAQREHGILEIDPNDGRRLLCELLARGCRRNGGRENKTLEGTEAYTVRKTDEVEVAEEVPFAPIEAISEAVC